MDKWNIRYIDENGECQSWVFTDINQLSKYEQSLKKDNIKYATDYYEGAQLIKGSRTKIK